MKGPLFLCVEAGHTETGKEGVRWPVFAIIQADGGDVRGPHGGDDDGLDGFGAQ